jgi:hypothetical protein
MSTAVGFNPTIPPISAEESSSQILSWTIS